ncbi:glycosyltransferase [Alteromonas sp. a30]|uniref:glycosyltransferase n=1 Tax=Alteromonas sp. a30 TaxID=2730917 RepID=UPI0022814E3C|nr:glycosyltransferase [Alteromonas sp. a30]MCY7294511.1 glycosyltransferase [Alteromonas sp. a30]
MNNYHVVRIAPVVNLTLRQEIAADPSYQGLSYDAYLEKILAGNYNYSDVFAYEMRKLGNRVDEIVYDVEGLQKQWAKENDLAMADGELWQVKIVLEQLKSLNPDVVYLQGFTRITAAAIYAIQDELPNVKKIAVHSGFPNGHDVVTKDTIIFAAFPNIQKSFSELGCETHLIYHFWDERILARMKPTQREIPFSFIGTSGNGFGPGHKTRYWELLKLAHNTPLEGWIDDKDAFVDPESDTNPFIEFPLKEQYYKDLDADYSTYPNPFAPMRYLMPKGTVHKPVYGDDYFQTLHDSLVTFQRHTDAMYSEIGAMRVFQATGAGACLLTNDGDNMSDLFERDTEVVTYTSLHECIEKANYLIEHPEKAREIAKKGQERTLRSHTAKERYAEVHQHLVNALKHC